MSSVQRVKRRPYDALRDYLERNRAEKGSKTHNIQGMGKELGNYNVPEDQYEKFMGLVHDTVFAQEPGACAILEKHLTQGGPILVDLDFRYTAGGQRIRRFDDQMLQNFVRMYAQTLYKFFDLSSLNGRKLRFFVMLKPEPEVAIKNGIKVHKDGVHIICPDITLSPQIQYTIRGYIIQKHLVQGTFDETGFINPESDVYDARVIDTNCWFLYGASKPDQACYDISAMYEIPTTLNMLNKGEVERWNIICDSLVEGDYSSMSKLDLMKLFSIRLGHTVVDAVKVLEEQDIAWESLYSKWAYGKGTAQTNVGGEMVHTNIIEEPHGDDGENMENFGLEADNNDWGEITTGYSNEDIDQALELMDKCLNPNKRAKDYGPWLDLGLCLYNINNSAQTPQDDKMISKWAAFSRRAEGYEHTPDEDYQKTWRGFHATNGKKIRIGSLHFWAEEDSPARYKEITEKSAIGWVTNNPDGSHGKVADLMKRLYKHVFCSTIMGRKDQTYFQYVGNYWKKLKSPNELWRRLTVNVVRLYMQTKFEVCRLERAAGSEGGTMDLKKVENEQNSLREKQKTITKTQTLLESTPFLENVLKACFHKFYNDNFVDMLNQHKDLIACGNCVIELRHYESGEIRFNERPSIFVRKGRPDDYISFVMGKDNELEPINIDYDAKTGKLTPFDPNTPEQKELAEFFAKVFPEVELREWVLTLLSACLEGENKEQNFYILQGSGGNGKSKLLNLMSCVFGEYQTSLNTAALTKKRPDSSAANPDIITLKSKRFIYMQEPDEGEKLNTARIKQFTGGDNVEARGLYADQERFKIMGRIFFSTNDLPPVQSMDGGTWRRMKVIPFVSAFKPKGHAEINPAKNVYEQDPNIDDKFKQNNMRAAFLRLLLHYWETRYLVSGLTMPPECVMEAVNRFKADNDSFVAFANECLIKEPDSEATLSEIMIKYKHWYSGQSARKQLKKPEIIERISKIATTYDGGRTFRGIRTVLDGEDISGNFLGQGFS
jgi:P4 family phage/plasmid primase-like protien